ncbi:MAG TPA: endolytic transglycosylase MltG [Streptosporangiaceae bacterium]|nr:endolytic transglycosylase MltG [Streptosporangiaceae bacterium]
MTRHRRNDPDDMNDGDAPWRARDYGQVPAPPEAGGDYYAAPWGGSAAGAPRSARGALGTSSGRDDRPGEATGPPWELPGWNDAVPAQRRTRDDSAHPSGPLPRVNSGPMPRLPSLGGAAGPGLAETWPPATSGPLPSVPRELWPADQSRYPVDRHRGGGFGSGDDTSYLRTGSGYGDGDLGSGEYPAQGGGAGYRGDDAGYDEPGYGHSFPGPGGHGRDYADDGDYAGTGYDEPGYHDEPGYAGEPDYPGQRGYAGDGGYPGPDYPGQAGYGDQDYARTDDYAGHDGYAGEPGYPGQDGYPAGHDDGYPDDTGYQASDDYLPGRGQAHSGPFDRPQRDDPDDHGYGDRGGWYGDVDEDQAWGEAEDDSGLLPGFSDEGDLRARGPAPSHPVRGERGGRGAPPSRPRGGKPKRKGPMRRAAPWIALTVLAVVIGVAGAGFFYVWHNYLHPPDYSGPGTGNVTVQIKPGETATQVGTQLQAQGVVASVRAFANAAKASGKGDSLEPGYYRMHKHMAATLAFALLLKPSSRIVLTVVITEGERLSEIIAALGQKTGDLQGYQQAIKNVSALGLPSYAKGNPEGYLFPATYTIQPGTQPIQVLRAMVLRYNKEAQSVSLSALANKDHISEGDAIIVASLIQAEGRRPQDLPKIARVIYNRLNQHMHLQLDTTVLYARHSRAADVTVAQTQNTKSPYNTYLHAGLPPGPIDSPGDIAIKAALHPSPTTDVWTYFLTVNPKTGLTKFTDSFTVFQQFQAELAHYTATHH